MSPVRINRPAAILLGFLSLVILAKVYFLLRNDFMELENSNFSDTTYEDAVIDEKSEIQDEEFDLESHGVPKWWSDTKLGIFIHYGVYSVPGYAPLNETNPENLQDKSAADAQFIKMKGMPYAEWYYNTMRLEGSKTQQYHKENYGNKNYFDFKNDFASEASKWDPAYWLSLFQGVRAGYVVLTTKHHEGFTLWKSDFESFNGKDVFVGRDIVNELAKSISGTNIKLGLYYSGGLDWQWNDIIDEEKWRPVQPPQPEYGAYALNQLKELALKYKPSILWNDLGWPKSTKNELLEYLKEFLASDSDSVVNDRWSLPKTAWRGDFLTPEYKLIETVQEKPFEMNRGLGQSFGFNRMEGKDDTIRPDDLARLFIDVVSKNGNMLLDIAPMADGKLAEVQEDCLLQFGTWLNGTEGLFNTKPFMKAGYSYEQGSTQMKNIRLTQSQSEDTLFIHILDPDEISEHKLELPKNTDIPIDDIKRLTKFCYLEGRQLSPVLESDEFITLNIFSNWISDHERLRLITGNNMPIVIKCMNQDLRFM